MRTHNIHLIVCHDYVDPQHTYISLLIDTHTRKKIPKNVVVCFIAHNSKVSSRAWLEVVVNAITSLIRKKIFTSTVRARTLMELGRIFN